MQPGCTSQSIPLAFGMPVAERFRPGADLGGDRRKLVTAEMSASWAALLCRRISLAARAMCTQITWLYVGHTLSTGQERVNISHMSSGIVSPSLGTSTTAVLMIFLFGSKHDPALISSRLPSVHQEFSLGQGKQRKSDQAHAKRMFTTGNARCVAQRNNQTRGSL